MVDTTEGTGRAPRPTLAAIASVFARYANTTFGGGSATIAVLKKQILTARGWITETEFDLNYALSRLTPGHQSPRVLHGRRLDHTAVVRRAGRADRVIAAVLAPGRDRDRVLHRAA